MTLSSLQIAWWSIISLIGALQFYMLLSFGAQSMLLQRMPELERQEIVRSSAHAYDNFWVLMLLFHTLSCVLFPIFRVLSEAWLALDLVFLLPLFFVWLRKHLNDGAMKKCIDAVLTICGVLGPFLLGCFMSCYFFGNTFTVGDMTDIEGSFKWVEVTSPSIFGDWRVLTFGFMTLMQSRMQANIWFLRMINEPEIKTWNRKQLCVNGTLFFVFFVMAMYALLASEGYQVVSRNEFEVVANKYLYNYIDLPIALACILLGIIMTGVGMWLGLSPLFKHKAHGSERGALLHSFMGTILVVTSFFIVAGFNDTPFFPSSIDMNSSMTIYNCSASEETLRIATYVFITILVFVSGFITLTRWGVRKVK